MNYIDTAPWYGQGVAETVLGHVLRDVERGSVYIATKVGRYEPAPLDMFDFTAARVRRSVYESLDRLGLEYLDVVNVRTNYHQPPPTHTAPCSTGLCAALHAASHHARTLCVLSVSRAVQVHDPEFAPCLSIITRETLPALAQLKAAGVVRHIGTSRGPLSSRFVWTAPSPAVAAH